MAASDRSSELNSTGESSYSTNSKPSVLDRLKCPEPYVYARSESHTYIPKSIPPTSMSKGVSDKGLTVSGTRLFWNTHILSYNTVIGPSLSEPHTSVTAVQKCVCMLACLLAAIYRKF